MVTVRKTFSQFSIDLENIHCGVTVCKVMSSLACFFLYICAKVCGRSFFRTSNIHTLHWLVICVRRLSVWGFCYVCERLF